MDAQQLLDVVRAENDQLRERISMLEAALFDVGSPFPVECRLTGQEARVMGVLMNRPVATKSAIMVALYSDRHDDELAEQKITDVFICKIRAKLKLFEVRIETRWGEGWSLHPDDRSRIRQELEAR